MSKWVVCPRCDGEGRHVNPAVDGNGLTREDFDELGPEFEDDYYAGVYDVACERCKGEKVVPRCRYKDTISQCDNDVEEGTWGEDADRSFEHCFFHMQGEEKADYEDRLEYISQLLMERRAGA